MMKPDGIFPRLIAVAGVLGLGACAKPVRPATADPASALPAVKARVMTAQRETFLPTTELPGTIRPLNRAQIAAKVMGSIEELPVTLGQRMRAGDLLVKISAADLAARLLQTQAQLTSARRDLERERGLLAQGASTADMVRGLEERATLTQAMVREAEAMLGFATIRAPFDGVIARRIANLGDLVQAGAVLLEIEGTADFQVEVAIPESVLGRLTTGAVLRVDVPRTGMAFDGTLAELSSAADVGARSVFAKLAVPANVAVRSGEFARVQIHGAPTQVLLVPSSAVSLFGQMERVFVVGEGGRADLRLVKTGAVRGERVEILAGIDPGERIVVAPPAMLREGQRVEAVP